ncbi:hypothetical protein BGM19_01850 [Streptomyces agglomeratus]|uniref:Uncharacterized protein n=1 Tax=Streptomyces agglomeratus TaxID=285458 RepID=A0A1E5PH12_9ACTN|nr:hypothetical protein AS594_34655 [Streptomyces agglomeratus]OEJ56950.1 hypothetical protein BGM19_01850 [Streptomyces agglomeratus]
MGTADLGLSAVDAQFDVFGLGVCEDVGQGAQPDARPVGNGEAPGGERRADLVDGEGDGGAGHVVQLGQCRVRQLQTQVDQGDRDPIGEDQRVVRLGSGGPFALSATPLAQL